MKNKKKLKPKNLVKNVADGFDGPRNKYHKFKGQYGKILNKALGGRFG